jgi:hypothetical protein
MERPCDFYIDEQPIWVLTYTEKRREALQIVQDKIKEYIEKCPDMPFDDMPIADKAMFWKMKADILWHPVMPLSFYEDDNFEIEYLQETEQLFFKDVEKSIALAEEYYLTARNYSGNGVASLKKSIWTNKIGSSRYNSFILANFNPVEADKIMDMRADQIAQAFVSKMCFEYIDPQTQKRR